MTGLDIESDHGRDLVHQAVQILADDGLIELTSDSGSQIVALLTSSPAVKAIQTAIESGPSDWSIMVRHWEEVFDLFPDFPPRAQPCLRKCQHAGAQLQIKLPWSGGLFEDVDVSQFLADADPQGFRIATAIDPLIAAFADLTTAPLIVVGLSMAEDTIKSIRCPTMQLPATPDIPAPAVLLNDADGWTCLTPGTLTHQELSHLMSDLTVFVCTGNTCRSPMAEGIFRKLLAERLGCKEDVLVDRGYSVASAGLAAASGYPASLESVQFVAEMDIDISGHGSQPLTAELFDRADRVYTMTRYHRESILAGRPDAAAKIQVLSRDGFDISDPIGGGYDEYSQCGSEIERHIRAILDELDLS